MGTIRRNRHCGNILDRSLRIERKTALLTAVSTIALLGVTSAEAQNAGPGPFAPPVAAAAPEQITVTATLRAEPVINVPESIGVISGVELQERQIRDFNDVAQTTPSLAVTVPNRAGQATYSIRGISSSSSPGAQGQATIGVYMDDVSVTGFTGPGGSGTVMPAFFDVSRIEVLRGPQGTLYGAGSMGGTIRVVTNLPNLNAYEEEAQGQLSYTENGGLNSLAEGVISAPIVDNTLAGRFGVHYEHLSGYIDRTNPLTGQVTKDFNDEDLIAAKGSLLYQSGDHTFTLVPAIWYQSDWSAGPPFGSKVATPYLATWYVSQPLSDKLIIPSVTATKELPNFAITSITSYFNRDLSAYRDFTIGGLGNLFLGVISPVQQLSTTEVHRYSEELRFVSPGIGEGRNYSWLLGAYVSRDIVHTTGNFAYQDLPGLTGALIQHYGPNSPFLQTALCCGTNEYSQATRLAVNQYAGFGEFNYAVLPEVVATAGFRYFGATEDYVLNSTGVFNFNGTGALVTSAGTTSSTALTPKFSLKYQPDADLNIYATATEGFRLGGVNQIIPAAACAADLKPLGLTNAPATYGPDKVWSYELGAKAAVGEVSVDGAVYEIDWSQTQQDVNLPSCSYDFIANVGTSRIRGADFEATAQILTDVTLNAAVGYTDNHITKAAPGTGTHVGDRLIGIPTWTANAGFTYELPVYGNLSPFLNFEGRYVGDSVGSFNPAQIGYLRPDYFTADGTVGVHITGIATVSIFGRNLFNNDKVIFQATSSPRPVLALRPRTIGINLTSAF